MEKKQTRKEQALQTRSNILTVCTGLLREHTFDELSISMICRDADISVGAFYHHFKTKSDIIVELCRDVDDVFVNDILPVCRQLPPLEAILQYLCEQCGYAETMGIDSIKNVYKAQIDNGNTFFASNARGLPDGLRCLLQRAVRECCLKTDTDIEKLLEDLLIMSRGVIYYWCIRNGEINVRDYIYHMAEGYLQAYLANPSISL